MLWKSLVCAQPLPPTSEWKYWLQISGLIHLFVVSGSHFLVLQFVLKKLRTPASVSFFVLWFYNAVTGFSPPGTRACMDLSCRMLFKVQEDQKLLMVALLCLALEPRWSLSYSFWLSWLACLILVVTPTLRIDLFRNMIFYVTWTLLGFSVSPWSVPMNLLVGPLISWVLFPLAFLSYIPGIPTIFHGSVLVLQKLMEWFAQNTHPLQFSFYLLPMASLVLLVHGILILRRLQWQGGRIH